MLLSSRAAALALSAGLTTAATAQTVPAYSIETRLVPLDTPVPGVTAMTMTLQARAIFTGAFPTDSTGSSAVRYGNFGIISMGFGPEGAAQPSTVIRHGAPSAIAGISLQRGAWDAYHIEPGGGEPAYDWAPRGAAPGVQAGPNSPTFTRGFRFFNNTSPNLDNATGNGNTGDGANGTFDASGNLTNFNLLRDDFSRPAAQQRNLVDADGGPAWQDIYRFTIIDSRGLIYLGTHTGDDVFSSVQFDGWFRAARQSGLIGNSWYLAGGDSVRSTAFVSFGNPAIPAPGAAMPFAGALLWAERRRRR